MKIKICKIVLIFLMLFACSFSLSAQSAGNENFPSGSTNGTTEMSEKTTGIDFPNISFSATSPKNGKEVAFSVELLLLLSLLFPQKAQALLPLQTHTSVEY